jgi:hypothetical protein
MTKTQSSKRSSGAAAAFRSFEIDHLDLFRISSFEFRISASRGFELPANRQIAIPESVPVAYNAAELTWL